MNPILTIFRKEIRVTLRDRRTLVSSILIPALIMPLLILGITRLQKKLNEDQGSRQLKVALIHPPPVIDSLFADPKITIISGVNQQAAQDSVKNESYDAALVFAPDFAGAIDSFKPGSISLYYKSTNFMVDKRIDAKLDQYGNDIMSRRFRQLHLSESILNPVKITRVDQASRKEQIGIIAGGFLPYIFIIFCFLGCMYPSLDLITGEKEKGTMETLLTAPVSRFNILLAKMLAIAAIGVCAAFMTITGMFAALRFMNGIPKELLTTINDTLTVRFVLMLFGMLIPLSLFFAGILSAICIRASSFKEAQSYVTPMTFVVLVPAMIALMPGIRLSWQTSWIPILNVALATKQITAGTMAPGQYLGIVASLIFFAVIALWISIRQFSNEKNILN